MIQLNLLPDLKKEFLNAQKTKSVVISSSIIITVAALALSVLLFIYVTFLQQVQINLATDDINRKTQELKNIKDIDKYLTIQSQLASLPKLHDGKGLYSRLFEFLGSINPAAPNDVKLTNLQALEADKAILFTGTTATFESLNIFVDTLKNADITYKTEGEDEAKTEKMFDQILIQNSGLSRANDKVVVSFTVKTVYKDALFNTKNTDMTVKVPAITTTPSVTQSPKGQEIFNSSGVTR